MADQTEIENARSLDEADVLRHLRGDFVIPSRADLKAKTLGKYILAVIYRGKKHKPIDSSAVFSDFQKLRHFLRFS